MSSLNQTPHEDRIRGFYRFATGVNFKFKGIYDVYIDSVFHGVYKDGVYAKGLSLGIHELLLAPRGVNPEGQPVDYYDLDGIVFKSIECWRPLPPGKHVQKVGTDDN